MKLLVFTPHGSIQLFASRSEKAKMLWSSDDDEDFYETVSDDFLDPNTEEDVDMVTDYLCDGGLIEEDEEFEIDEQYLDDAVGPGDEEDDDDDDDDDEYGSANSDERYDPDSTRIGFVERARR